MNEFKVESLAMHTVAALVERKEHADYVVQDVHKEMIAIAELRGAVL
jgi:hypothetical protein